MTTFKTALPLLLALAPLSLVACTASSKSSEPVAIAQASVARDAPSTAALTPAVTANNTFALKLYPQVSAAIGGNVMTSPVSASLALTMAYAGAQGDTATQMASALQLGSATDDAVFAGQNALSQALEGRAAAALSSAQAQAKAGLTTAPSPSNYAFTVVNSLWGQKGYTWAAPFLNVMAKSYGTGVYLEDFQNDALGATSTINSWVSDATADKVNNLLTQTLDPDTRMVLVNAIHLKLPWASPFDASATKNGSFTRGDGTAVTASFMHETADEMLYAETADAQVVSLPLAGGDLSVVLALPKNGLASLVSSLTPDTWAAMTTAQAKTVILSLPKFTFTSPSVSLKKPLQALGMTDAFDPIKANFDGLSATANSGIHIFDVLQKATMAADEVGVEAAAATAVIMGVSSAPIPTPPVTVTLDHPFLVSIVDSSGAIVFLGQIDDPTNAGSK